MTDEQHDRTPDAVPAPVVEYCLTQPNPGTFLTLARCVAPCPDCGHATVLHIGVDHCPVCEMVALNTRQAAASTAQDQQITITLDDSRMAVAEQAWADVQRRHRMQQIGKR